ncbi:MAG TPA: type 4a pilus biogenesis protein PilO [Desulfuromonadales bacterium]|nr:type 4a pilus biogenesis protein PilO [Desulfuromonadales bacterium]
MKQYVFEIVRQKWRLLGVIAFIILLNVTFSVVISAYQLPLVATLQTKWSDLRQKAARSGKVDAATLYQMGTADLAKLTAAIPEKREFARILSDLLEAAAASNVEVGAISYKPEQLKEEPLLSYQLSLSVNGSYAGVKSYLSDLQNSQELLVVDMVTFSNSDLYVESVVMDVRLTVYLRGGA